MTRNDDAPAQRVLPVSGAANPRHDGRAWWFLRLLLIVACAEVLVMLLLARVPLAPEVEMLVDAVLLALFVAWPVWKLLGAPLRQALVHLDGTRNELEAAELERGELLGMLEAAALVSVTDADDRFLYVNDNFCRVFGWPREALLGQDFTRLNSGRHDEAFWADLRATVQRGEAWHGEVCSRTRAGAELWMDTVVTTIPGPDGLPARHLSMRLDVTERKRGEQAMRTLVEASSTSTGVEFLTSVARGLAEALDLKFVVIGELDPDRPRHVRSVAVWANGAPGESFSYDLAGTPCSEVVDDRQSCLHLEDVQSRFPEDSLLAIFGVHAYAGTPLLGADGRAIGVLVALDDRARPDLAGCTSLLTLHSERVAAELRRMRLERQVQRLSRAVESAADVVVITDPTGRIEYVNPAFSRVTGWTFEEARGRNMRLLKSGEQDDDYYRRMWTELRAGRSWSGRVVNRRKDGSNYHADLNVSPLSRDDGQVSGYVGVQRDVSHLVEHERELSEARTAAEAASRAKSEFLANMSHEIRTPMNGVLGMTQLLLDTHLAPDQRDYALTVRRSAEALLAILNDILDFSKIEAGKLAIESESFEWTTAVEEVVELLGARAEEKGLVLALGWDDGLPSRVVGDAGRLRQILMNLAGNALKFTERGHVAIHVSADARAGSRVTLRFSVRDSGIGLTPEQRERLFERFEQADGSNTRRFGGTGLGLAISRQLARLMGGDVGCESALGAGSTFWFTLDLEVADPSPALAGIGGALAGARVVVAHHDAAMRAAIAPLCAARGADVLEADSPEAAKALAMTEAGPGTIVLLDQAFAERWSDRRTPVLLLATAPARTRMAEFEAHGFAGCLLQPFRPGVLLQAAGRIVASARAGERGAFVTRQALIDRAHDEWAQSAGASRALVGARVLVAEDNAVNQRVAVGLLKRMSCVVAVARDGREALEHVLANRYDAVLMDCQMPVMDGYEATRRIRAHEAETGARRLPIVALTASALIGDREECLEAGMDDFLTKPVKVDELRTVLAHWIARNGESEGPAPGEAQAA